MKTNVQVPPFASKYFILSIVFLPHLFQYTTPLSGFTWGDCFLMFSGVIYFLSGSYRVESKFLGLITYIVILTFLLKMNGEVMRITTTIHYLAYLIMVMLMRRLTEYRKYFIDIYCKSTLVSAGLMVIQTIALQTEGICIPGVLTFLPLTDENMYDYANVVISHNSGRCMSFFAEPSHYAVYVLPFLILKLISCNGINKNNLLQAAFVTVSLIMCASFTGILSAIFVWGIFVVILALNRKLYFQHILLITIAGIVCAYLMLNSFSGNYLSDGDIYERQSAGRFIGFSFLDVVNISNNAFYFGSGMNEIGETIYLPGWPRLLYYYGIVGSALYVITLVSCIHRKTVSFIILALLGILMIGTEVNFGCYFVLYMLCIYCTRDIPLLQTTNYK